MRSASSRKPDRRSALNSAGMCDSIPDCGTCPRASGRQTGAGRFAVPRPAFCSPSPECAPELPLARSARALAPVMPAHSNFFSAVISGSDSVLIPLRNSWVPRGRAVLAILFRGERDLL
jgi:hypothetical protein